MSHHRRRPLSWAHRDDAHRSQLSRPALSSSSFLQRRGVTSGPLGQTAKSAPTVRGPFVYPAVKPLVFTGSLASLPIAQPGPSWDLPIGFPRAPQLLQPGGGTLKPMRHPQRTAALRTRPLRRSTSRTCIPTSTAASTCCCPADPNGDVGPNHYIQMVNSSFQIFNKAGTSLAGPSRISTIWAGAGDMADCATTTTATRSSSTTGPRTVADQPVRDPERPLQRTLLGVHRDLADGRPRQRRLVRLHVPDPGRPARLPEVRGLAGRLLHGLPAGATPAGASTRGRSTA